MKITHNPAKYSSRSIFQLVESWSLGILGRLEFPLELFSRSLTLFDFPQSHFTVSPSLGEGRHVSLAPGASDTKIQTRTVSPGLVPRPLQMARACPWRVVRAGRTPHPLGGTGASGHLWSTRHLFLGSVHLYRLRHNADFLFLFQTHPDPSPNSSS